MLKPLIVETRPEIRSLHDVRKTGHVWIINVQVSHQPLFHHVACPEANFDPGARRSAFIVLIHGEASTGFQATCEPRFFDIVEVRVADRPEAAFPINLRLQQREEVFRDLSQAEEIPEHVQLRDFPLTGILFQGETECVHLLDQPQQEGRVIVFGQRVGRLSAEQLADLERYLKPAPTTYDPVVWSKTGSQPYAVIQDIL
ncbi:hypothetical protein KQI52_12915 [bacterium]|nr:hypothetical protein [bacterium]